MLMFRDKKIKVHPVDAYLYLIILNLTLTDFHLLLFTLG